ncbi:MAG: hypothetical protein ACHQ50_12860 [Fimbriimonadales bacterium]
MKEAKELFFQYDGSRFYMSHDGVEADYLSAGVPPEAEAAWLRELTQDKLRLLSQEGNWMVLHFLNDHAGIGHLAEVVQADPKGKLWQRCAYLEQFLDYTDKARRAGGEPSLVSRAFRKAIVEAERLLKRARSEDSIQRVRAVVVQAHQFLGEIEMG